jgi:hypothetical protein
MTMDTQIPVIAEKLSVFCGCRKFHLGVLGDHLCTCTTHSGAKKDHDWTVDQLVDLFRTTHKVKTEQVTKIRGRHCGDIELVVYLENTSGPVSLVLDLHIAHDRFESNSDPSLKHRGRHCGDIELVTYLANVTDSVPLVLNLRIDHDRFGSSSDPSLNGHLHYPNDIDTSFKQAVVDKIRKYRSDFLECLGDYIVNS